jgi:lysophospholipase
MKNNKRRIVVVRKSPISCLATSLFALIAIVAGASCDNSCSESKVNIAFDLLPGGMANRYDLTTEENFVSTHRDQVTRLLSSSHDLPLESDHPADGNGPVTLTYRIFAPEFDSGKGAIVISTGRTEALITYGELVHDLTRQGYYVYVLNHRGQGSSTRLIAGDDRRERGHVDDFNFYVDDLHKLVTNVVKKHSPSHPRLFLLAHSMGGGIASLYLEREAFRKDFTAAALITPMHQPVLGGEKVTRLLAWANRRIPMMAADRYGVAQKGYCPAPFVANDLSHSKVRYENLRELYGRPENAAQRIGGVTHGWIRQAYAAANIARTNAGDIAIPVLLLQATEDTAVAGWAQTEFCAGVGRTAGGCCKGFAIEKSFHAVFIEADNFRIPAMTTVLDFFDHPPSPGKCHDWRPGPVSGAITTVRP